MNQQQVPVRFVRIKKQDHPMHGMIGTVSEETEDGFHRVTVLKTSVNAFLKPEDLQPIEIGTKVCIEVTILDFFQNSMMVAGGWMSLDRIQEVVESKMSYVISQVMNAQGEMAWGIFRYTVGQERQLVEVKPTLKEAKARSRELNA